MGVSRSIAEAAGSYPPAPGAKPPTARIAALWRDGVAAGAVAGLLSGAPYWPGLNGTGPRSSLCAGEGGDSDGARPVNASGPSTTERRREIARGLVGRRRELDLVLAAVTAGRDVVLEGPPGTSKSTI